MGKNPVCRRERFVDGEVMTAAVIHMFEFEHPCALCGVNTQVEFLDRPDGYDSLVCPACWEVHDAELHVSSCRCRHCLARHAAETARQRLAQRRARVAEYERLKSIGAIVGEGDEEDISW